MNREREDEVAETVTEQVVDFQSAIERLGSETLLKKVARVFLVNTPERISQIREAVSAGDSRSLEMSAHTLVSSMAYLSARDAIDAALQLEQMGREGNLSDAENTCEKLEIEIERLEAALSTYLGQGE